MTEQTVYRNVYVGWHGDQWIGPPHDSKEEANNKGRLFGNLVYRLNITPKGKPE